MRTYDPTDAFPLRFEDEYPEEAQNLMNICQDSKYRRYAALTCNFLRPTALINFFKGLVRQKDGSVRSDNKVGRNDPCPCGSNIKFKKCCMK